MAMGLNPNSRAGARQFGKNYSTFLGIFWSKNGSSDAGLTCWKILCYACFCVHYVFWFEN